MHGFVVCAGFVPYVTTGRRLLPDDEGGVRITYNSDGTYTVRIMRIQEETTVTVTAGFPVATEYITERIAAKYTRTAYQRGCSGNRGSLSVVSICCRRVRHRTGKAEIQGCCRTVNNPASGFRNGE
ncbi:MAG: hypothetical protein LBL07_09850 [Tannerella sp.]|jgi:hypothetical protein|nr:hypothetical protein [Tannerella sp.]